MPVQTVIDPGIKTPGVYVDVLFGVGPRSSGGSRKVLVYGNKLAAGSAVVEEPVLVSSEDDARTLFGAGSELFLSCVAALRANPSVELWAIPITESVGAKASGDITVTGTATSAGTIEVRVLDELVRVPYALGDDQTAVAAAIVAGVTSKTDWPVTAANALGVVTLTAKQNGPRGGAAYGSVVTEGSGITTADAGAYLSGGATSDDSQNALDAVEATRFHYHAAPYDDAVELAKFKLHVDDQALPTSGIREQAIACSPDTLGGATTLATGLNSARMQVLWHFNALQTPGMIAAAMAAYRAFVEALDPSHNHDGDELKGISPQRSQADRPTKTELASALNNGLTPLQFGGGRTSVVRSITTRSQDASSNPDYRVLDTAKVTVPDAFADDIATGFGDEFPNFKADVDDPDGKAPLPGVLTPQVLKDWIYSRQVAFEDRNLISGVDGNLPNLVVALAGSPAGRFNAQIPLDVVDGAHQFSAQVRQVG